MFKLLSFYNSKLDGNQNFFLFECVKVKVALRLPLDFTYMSTCLAQMSDWVLNINHESNTLFVFNTKKIFSFYLNMYLETISLNMETGQ